MLDFNTSISKAIYIFRRSSDASDVDVYNALVASGEEGQNAARIVEFLPIVYCRLILVSKGVKFADTFRRTLSEGQLSADKPLSSEPLWKACVAFANTEVRSGVSGKELLVIAARSAEFDAVNRLLNGGSKLEQITLLPPVLMWPEHGPSNNN